MAKKKRPAPPTHVEEDSPDDLFVAKTIEVTTWARRNTQLLVVLGVVVALLASAGLYYLNYRSGLNTRAVTALESIQQTVGLGQPDQAKAQLGEYLEQYGSTRHAAEARLLLGQLYLESNQPDEAIVALEETADNLRSPLGIQAASLLAKAYEQQGQWQQAEALYLRVADRARLEFQSVQALSDAARMRERLGNREGAAQLYEQVLGSLDETDPRRGLFEMRLHEVRPETTA